MSHPYCIWTTQRTGGTTLSSILGSMSSHPVIQDEPFLIDRVLGCVYSEFWEVGPQIFEDYSPLFFDVGGVFKHCFNGAVKLDFELALHKFTSSKGYKHIYLYRENVLNEYLSLALATVTDVWTYSHRGKYDKEDAYEVNLRPLGIKVKRLEAKKDRILSEVMAQEFFFKVSFEELYLNNSAPSKWQELFEYLNFDAEIISSKLDELPLILNRTNQKSRDHYNKIKNLDAVISLISSLVK